MYIIDASYTFRKRLFTRTWLGYQHIPPKNKHRKHKEKIK